MNRLVAMRYTELCTQGIRLVLPHRLSSLVGAEERKLRHWEGWCLVCVIQKIRQVGMGPERPDSAPCCEQGTEVLFHYTVSRIRIFKSCAGNRWRCWEINPSPGLVSAWSASWLSALCTGLCQQRSWPVWSNSLLNSSGLFYEGRRVWEVTVDYRMLFIPGQGFLVYYNDCRGGLLPTTNCLFSKDASSW